MLLMYAVAVGAGAECVYQRLSVLLMHAVAVGRAGAVYTRGYECC